MVTAKGGDVIFSIFDKAASIPYVMVSLTMHGILSGTVLHGRYDMHVLALHKNTFRVRSSSIGSFAYICRPAYQCFI